MRRTIKQVFAYLLMKLYSFKKHDPEIISIFFHDPPKKLFENTVKWLIKNNYKIISLKELNIILDEKLKAGKHAVITFDDGWQNNLKLINTVEKYNVPIAIFIPTEAVISGNYWFEFARQKDQNAFSGIKNIGEFKNLAASELKNKIDTLKRHYRLRRSCMTLQELKRISEIDLITIGSHTVTHPILQQCPIEMQELELRQSKETLAKWIGKEIKYLAFPNGDYDEHTIRIAKDCNYKLCFTIKPGKINVEDADRFRINRCCIDDNDGFYTSVAKTMGIWQKYFPKKSQNN